jgi:uncharacterized protein YfaS (alpha-2-macroglobulin family)
MSTIKSGVLRLTMLLTLLCSFGIAFSQSYQSINTKIDSLVVIGLPKSALIEVDKLDQLARKENNVPMQIKAAFYRMTFQSYIEENPLVIIINRLKLDAQSASYPVKPVLQSVLAGMYYQYYQQNRYQFAQRTHLDKPSADFTQWDLQTILDEISRLYKSSLSDSKREQATPIDILDGILTGDKNARFLRPTLYDLLLHRALDFFLAEEPALTRPKLAFDLNDTRFFSDSRTFAGISIKTSDSVSTFYVGLHYLQQATLFHLQNHQDEALADLDLRRLQFLYNKTSLTDKDSLYTTALKRIALTYSENLISADALIVLANYEKNKRNFKEAMDYAQKAVSTFPESLGGHNGVVLIKEIQQKELTVNVENKNIPGEPILAQIIYRNINSVNYKIYRLTDAQYKLYSENHKKFDRDNSKLKTTDLLLPLLKNIKPSPIIELQLPDPKDYTSHTTEFKIDQLKPGNYLVWMEDAESVDSSLINFVDFSVSWLSYIMRTNPDNNIEFRVMNRKTGEPLKNVTVTLAIHSTTNNAAMVKSGLTDVKGIYRPEKPIPQDHPLVDVQLKSSGDTLTEPSLRIYYEFFGFNNDKPTDHTVLFTDRQIYRPGQTIYFKGLQLLVTNGRSAIETNKEVSVQFIETSMKVAGTLKLTTNEFGTFNGSFMIPQNILNGSLRIQTNAGMVVVQVEDYKRNSFKTEMLAVKECYKPNDSIKLQGQVKAFSGYGLSQARVIYHITRRQAIANNINEPYYNYRSILPELTEIKTDTVTTNEQGKFQIKFMASPKENADLNKIIYTYSISIDVTDATGETHSVNSVVKVAKNNLVLSANIPVEYNIQDNGRVAIGINNLNGQLQNGALRVQVFSVPSPDHLVKRREWQVPDQFLMDKTTFKSAFPYYSYRNEDDNKTWPMGPQVFDTTLQVNDSTLSYFNLRSLKNQASGLYRVFIHASNQQGDSTSLKKDFNLIADHPKTISLDRWVIPVMNKVKPGTPAEFLVGSDGQGDVLVEKYIGEKIASSQWVHLPGGLQRIKVPTAINDSNILVQFMMVRQNRVYTDYQPISIIKPDNHLNIKLVTFRDKLQPGEKEQWKLQVSGADHQKSVAEMVAGMYDASLDDITASQDWAGGVNLPQRIVLRYFRWDIYGFERATSSEPLIRKYYNYVQQPYRYESLRMFGSGANSGYANNYFQFLNSINRKKSLIENDKKLESDYIRNAEQVKTGVDISGRVTERKNGAALSGVNLKIKGTSIMTTTNSKGYFKIKIPLKDTLLFSLLGYSNLGKVISKAEIVDITLTSNISSLNEVIVVGYGTQKKSGNNGLTYSVVEEEEKPLMSIGGGAYEEKAAQSTLRGGSNNLIAIRGVPGLPAANQPLVIIDGVIAGNNNINALNPDDIADITILNGESVIAKYGASAVNGVMIITTKKGKSQQLIQTRTNFNETAFFYPQLRTDEKGEILIDFTIPDALTKWRFKAFAHTKDLQTGYLEQEIVTQKQLSISANLPRFLREGDTITISARLVNLTATPLKGNVQLQLFNALNMQPVSLFVNAAEKQQSFDLAASTNKAVSFKLFIPAGLEALTYKLTADAGQFTDGEENTLPVLPNRMLVIESMPMMVRAGQARSFTFDKLVNQTSSTIQNKTLTLEFTQNPAWYAIQALPYMMEFPYECSEQVFSRYYANSLATNLVNHYPVVKQVFDQWKNTNSPELLSNLEKNQELKATLIEETPWLQDAMNESEQKKRIALLFDLNKMSYELQQNLDKLQKKQLPGGGFPWFGGEYPDRYITQHILEGIGQLYHLKIEDAKNTVLKNIADNAMVWLDQELIKDANSAKDHKTYNDRVVGPMEIHSYFLKSYYPNLTMSADMKALLTDYLQHAEKQWVNMNVYQQAMIALTLLRNNKPEVAQKIINSLNEIAQRSDDMGMYWAKNQLGYYWYESPIETQSLMIELFTEAGNYTKAVEEMKIWLLRSKQTANWKTTKATAAACYALLMNQDSWLEGGGTSEIKLGGKSLQELKPEVKADTGTGYIKTSWNDEQIKPSMGKVEIQNTGKSMNWGAMHWQYLENLDKITSSKTDIQLERKYFIQKQTDSGPVFTEVDLQHQPQTGDLLKVIAYLKAGRDFEYIQLKDIRPAGTEPVDVISAFKNQDGLYYYQVTKDVATNFFISKLNKGSYVFEYRLRVVQAGNYSTGISTVQSMYAPEFNAHSEGTRMLIKGN